MFTTKIYDASNNDSFIGFATFDENERKVVDVSSDFELTDELEAALMKNVGEICDMHNVMRTDPDANDALTVDMETPDHRSIIVKITNEEDGE